MKHTFEQVYKESGIASGNLTENTKFSKSPLDKNWEKSYNLYTATDDFVRQVPSTMRHDFARSLANKTSGMAEGETRTVYIYAGNVYAFRADGYMHGEMITSFSPDNKQMLEDIAYEYDTIDKSTENAALWSEVVQSDKGGRSFHGSIVDGGRPNSADTLSKNSSERFTARYTERERQTIEPKEEIDEVVNKLREMYGLDAKKSNGTFEETKSNDIAPVKASSTNDVFFDGKKTKFSFSKFGDTPKRLGSYNISGDDVRLDAPTQENIAPVQEDISEAETTTPTISNMEQVEDYAPITEEEANALQSENIESLSDADVPPEMEAPYYSESESETPVKEAYCDRAKQAGQLMHFIKTFKRYSGLTPYQYPKAHFKK